MHTCPGSGQVSQVTGAAAQIQDSITGLGAEKPDGCSLPGALNTEAEQGIHEIVFWRYPLEVLPNSGGFFGFIESLKAEARLPGRTHVLVQLLFAIR